MCTFSSVYFTTLCWNPWLPTTATSILSSPHKKSLSMQMSDWLEKKKAHSSRNIHSAGLNSASEDSPLHSLMRLIFQWNSWCCSFCTKGKWKYKASLHCVPRPATSLSPRSVPALDPESYCHASTTLISSDCFSLQWTEFQSKTISHPLSNISFESLEKANKIRC